MPVTNYACIDCKTWMRPRKNSITVEETMQQGDPEQSVPYKLWQADLWECPICCSQIATGFGMGPIAEHYQPDYEDIKERFEPVYEIGKLLPLEKA